MSKLGDFGRLLTDTFTGPTHYDSGLLKLGFDSSEESAPSLVARIFGGRVVATGDRISVRVVTQVFGCDAVQARVLAKHLLAAADAIEQAGKGERVS